MKRPFVIVLLTIALTLVCLGIGAVLFFTFSGGLPTGNPFDVNNFSAQAEESKTIKVDGKKPLSLHVVDDSGSVTIVGADVETIEVKVTKTAYAISQAKADEKLKTIKYSIEQSGNKVTIKYELPDTITINEQLSSVDFVVTVPNEITVDVETNTGRVSVANIKGAVTVKNDFGPVEIENVEGALSVENNSGEVTAASIKAGAQDIELNSDFGSITLRQASGKDITLTSNSGKITLDETRATGDIVTKTDFGDTDFENGSAKSLSIETNSGTVELVKLNVSGPIKVDDDFGNIELEQAIGGSYDLHTNSGAITIDGAKGVLKTYTDFGNIKIENADQVTLDIKTNSGTIEFSGSLGEGPHLVKSDFGPIDLTLPADSAFNVDLKTDFGKIRSDLPITVNLTGDSAVDGDQITGTINGGGAQLTVQANSGNINIHAVK